MTGDEKTGAADPPEPPADDGDVIIEFVDHDEGAAETPGGEPETGMAEVVGKGVASEREAVLEKEVSALEERLLRRQADFENYKRRQEREQDELRRNAAASAVAGLLPALDNLDRAIEAVSQEVSEDHRKGLLLVQGQILEALGKLGLEEIDAMGKTFDPALHEAVAMAHVADVPSMTVTAVLGKGYLMGGKLLRAARVQVNEGAGGDQGESDA